MYATEKKRQIEDFAARAGGIDKKTFDLVKEFAVKLADEPTVADDIAHYTGGLIGKEQIDAFTDKMKEIGAGAFMEKAIGIGTSLGQVLNKSLTFFYKWGAYSKLQTAIDTYNQARAGGGNHDQAMDDVKQLLTMRDSGGHDQGPRPSRPEARARTTGDVREEEVGAGHTACAARLLLVGLRQELPPAGRGAERIEQRPGDTVGGPLLGLHPMHHPVGRN